MIKKVLNNVGKSLTVHETSKTISCNKAYNGMNIIDNRLTTV